MILRYFFVPGPPSAIEARMPVLVVHGDRGRVTAHETLVSQARAVWQRWADDATVAMLPCGHFLAEEQPDALTAMLQTFFKGQPEGAVD